MKLFEASKFKRMRKKIKSEKEKEALKKAILTVMKNPLEGKKLKGEFKNLRCYRYSAQRQERRLVYKVEAGTLYLLSFGPREGIYR